MSTTFTSGGIDDCTEQSVKRTTFDHILILTFNGHSLIIWFREHFRPIRSRRRSVVSRTLTLDGIHLISYDDPRIRLPPTQKDASSLKVGFAEDSVYIISGGVTVMRQGFTQQHLKVEQSILLILSF